MAFHLSVEGKRILVATRNAIIDAAGDWFHIPHQPSRRQRDIPEGLTREFTKEVDSNLIHNRENGDVELQSFSPSISPEKEEIAFTPSEMRSDEYGLRVPSLSVS